MARKIGLLSGASAEARGVSVPGPWLARLPPLRDHAETSAAGTTSPHALAGCRPARDRFGAAPGRRRRRGGKQWVSRAATAACCAGPRGAAGSTTASSTRSATRPCVRINRLAPAHVDALRQVRVLQPGRLGQGPPGAQHHRGGRARRHAEARPDRGRGDQRQHRHRARDGLRRQGLSAGRHHGRQLLGRAAAADALPRRQGGADAAGAEGLRHVHEGQGARRRRTAGSWRASSRPRPTPTSTRARRRRRSSPTSRASGSTTSSPATAPAARSRASGGC